MNPQIGFLLNKSLESLRNSNLESAELYLKQAIRFQPSNPHVLRLLGVIYAQRKQYSEALKYLNDSLKSLPKNSLALSNLGNIFLELKDYNNALDAYGKAIKIDPRYAEAWSNKGNTLNELKRYEEAIAHYDKALSLKPDYAEAWSNKGNTLNELKRYEEAIAHYDKALSLKADIDWVSGDLLHAKMKICSWSGLAESLENISKKVVANEKVAQPFLLLALNDDTLLHKKSSEIYAQHKRPVNKKIRIGYFSADFRNHPVSMLTVELFELYDKNRFDIIAFSFGADDKSPMRLRLSQAFTQFIDVSGMSDLDIAKLSRELYIDIAVDLGGYTAHNRTGAFAYQAAPVQVSYLGYLGTMGAEYIDYLFADKNIISEGLQKNYTEQIAYLPSYQVNDRKRIVSDRQFTRQELGLPENGFVFCCFNNNYKILPGVFAIWMRILKAIEGSVLFLYAENKWTEENLKKEAEVNGINSGRLVFGKSIPTDEYLARYRVCDLFLDTLPYNAGTTASDALWVGLPVLTLMGRSFASRVAASLLNAIGLPELITNTQEEYEALAVELAMNPKKLANIKLKLANNRLTTPLFDTPLFTKNLESAYIKMYERYQADLQPDFISIP
jgi:protein O-GlcNAc transferase